MKAGLEQDLGSFGQARGFRVSGFGFLGFPVFRGFRPGGWGGGGGGGGGRGCGLGFGVSGFWVLGVVEFFGVGTLKFRALGFGGLRV